MEKDIAQIVVDLKQIATEAFESGNLNAAIAAKKAVADILMKQSKLSSLSFDIESLSLEKLEELCLAIEKRLLTVSENSLKEKN